MAKNKLLGFLLLAEFLFFLRKVSEIYIKKFLGTLSTNLLELTVSEDVEFAYF